MPRLRGFDPCPVISDLSPFPWQLYARYWTWLLPHLRYRPARHSSREPKPQDIIIELDYERPQGQHSLYTFSKQVARRFMNKCTAFYIFTSDIYDYASDDIYKYLIFRWANWDAENPEPGRRYDLDLFIAAPMLLEMSSALSLTTVVQIHKLIVERAKFWESDMTIRRAHPLTGFYVTHMFESSFILANGRNWHDWKRANPGTECTKNMEVQVVMRASVLEDEERELYNFEDIGGSTSGSEVWLKATMTLEEATEMMLGTAAQCCDTQDTGARDISPS